MVINKQRFELILAQKNLTLGRLSEQSGLSRQSLSTIKCRGTCRPDTAAKLAKGLGVDVTELLEEEQR